MIYMKMKKLMKMKQKNWQIALRQFFKSSVTKRRQVPATWSFSGTRRFSGRQTSERESSTPKTETCERTIQLLLYKKAEEAARCEKEVVSIGLRW